MYSAIASAFRQTFHDEPQLIVRSPGRVNLIGEHTDYNGGYVLPAAIDRAIWFAVSPRADSECHFVAHDLGESVRVSMENPVKKNDRGWSNYLMGVLAELKKSGHKLLGINLVFGGDLPSGGGLSSSAAIENGVGFAVNELFGLRLSRLDLVRLSQRAENDFVGMNCGIMDMFASMMGQKNKVIRLDCRSLEYEYFPFDAPDLSLVLCDTGVKHQLVDSEYNTRRAECEEGVSVLNTYNPGVSSLRDVSPDFLKKHENDLRPVVFQRCKYVIEETARVENACTALINKDFRTFGQLMFKTHDGLNLEYEVSCMELNFLAEQARAHPACLGARMMGGGFGGCTINLVKTEAQETFTAGLREAYGRKFGRNMPAYPVRLDDGTGIVTT